MFCIAPRRALEMKIKNRKRPLGRPRLRWIDQIREDQQVRGVEWIKIMNEECWEDRYVWRRLMPDFSKVEISVG